MWGPVGLASVGKEGNWVSNVPGWAGSFAHGDLPQVMWPCWEHRPSPGERPVCAWICCVLASASPLFLPLAGTLGMAGLHLSINTDSYLSRAHRVPRAQSSCWKEGNRISQNPRTHRWHVERWEKRALLWAFLRGSVTRLVGT